jgi:predicted kinase
MVLVGGAPGTGKTTLADGLGRRTGWCVLRSDVVRKELADLDPLVPAPASLGQGLYSPKMTRRTYEELLSRTRVALGLGESVILDASWTDAGARDAAARIADATSSTLVELRCTVDPAVADARIERRLQRGDDASDADRAVAAALRTAAAPWPEAVTVDTSGSPSAAVELAWAAVRATTDAR